MKRNTVDKETKELMEDLSTLTMYLLQRRGPLSFTFLLEDNKKLTVTIGEHPECSCSPRSKGHCAHSIYVLNRIFKIDFSSEIYKKSVLSDNDLTFILEHDHRKLPSDSKKEEIEDFTPTGKSLAENNTCSICQDDMYSAQGIFACSKGCFNYFHMHCMQIWLKHKSNEESKCPMCRAIIDRKDVKPAFTKKAQTSVPHKGIDCSSCERTNILFERFKCLDCEDSDHCYECIKWGKHSKDHVFLVKRNPSDRWIGAEKHHSLVYKAKNVGMCNFLVHSLPDYTFSDDVQMFCSICKVKRVSTLPNMKLVQMPCDCVAHLKCVETHFLTKDSEIFNKCRFCEELIYPGLAKIKFQPKKSVRKKSASQKTTLPAIRNPPKQAIKKGNNDNLQDIQSLLRIENLKNTVKKKVKRAETKVYSKVKSVYFKPLNFALSPIINLK